MHQGNQELKKELKQHLDLGEILVWEGKPEQGIKLQKIDILMIPFSLMWGGFAFFWEYMALSASAPFFFKLWGIPFVLVGIYLIIGRFFYDAKRRENTFYGITKDRLIIKSGIFSTEISSLNLDNLSGLTLIEYGGGDGTIVLGNETTYANFFRGTGWPTGRSVIAPALENIKNARQVYKQITNLQKKN